MATTIPIIAKANDPAAEPIAALYTALTQAMKDGATLGFKGRYALIEPVLRQGFDIPEMTKRAVGPAWTKMPADQQGQLSDVFARYMIATYAARFDHFAGQSFKINQSLVLASMDVLVRTTLDPGEGDPVELDYLCRQDAARVWRVTDIYLAGSASEIVRLRADFASTLRAGGAPALIQALEAKIAEMGGS